MNISIFDYIYSAFALIKYFCEKDNDNAAFPYGFCEMKAPVIEIDRFENYFKFIDVNKNT